MQVFSPCACFPLNLHQPVLVKAGDDFCTGITSGVTQYSGARYTIIHLTVDMAVEPSRNLVFVQQGFHIVTIGQLFQRMSRIIPAPQARRMMSYYNSFP